MYLVQAKSQDQAILTMAPQSRAQGGEEALISGLRLGDALTSAASGRDSWLCLWVRGCGARGNKVTICKVGRGGTQACRWEGPPRGA